MTQVSKESQIEKETRVRLSKYNSDQLTKKLESNQLIGVSKEIAEDILKKRASKVENSSQSEEIVSVTIEAKSPVKKEIVIKKVKESEKILQTEKISVKKTTLDSTTREQILELKKQGKSVYFIRKQLNLTWSKVNNLLKKADESK